MHKFSLKKIREKRVRGKSLNVCRTQENYQEQVDFVFVFFSRRGRPCQNVSPKRAGEKYKRKTWNAEQIIHLSIYLTQGDQLSRNAREKKSNIEVEKLWRAEIREVHCAREVFRFRFSCRYIYMYVCMYTVMFPGCRPKLMPRNLASNLWQTAKWKWKTNGDKLIW